jgi:DNA-binding HxlR family transcriptional regulator
VIGGPGAFMVIAHGYDDFGQAITKKLIAEIANVSPGMLPATVQHAEDQGAIGRSKLALN